MPEESPPANPEQSALAEVLVEPPPRWASGGGRHRLWVGGRGDESTVVTITPDGTLYRVVRHGDWRGTQPSTVGTLPEAVALVIEIGIDHDVEVPPFFDAAGVEWTREIPGALVLRIDGRECASAYQTDACAPHPSAGHANTTARWGDHAHFIGDDLRAAVGVIIARAAANGVGVEWPEVWPDGTVPGQSHELAAAVEAIGEVLPDESLLREAHDAGYRRGYRNAVEDKRTGEAEAFGPGDSFDLWLDERGATPPIAATAEKPRLVAEWRRVGGVLQLRLDIGVAVIECRYGWGVSGLGYQQTCDDEAMGRGIATEWAQEMGYEVPPYRVPDEHTAGVERDEMQRFLDGAGAWMLPVLPTSEAADAAIDRFVASRKAGGGPE